MPEYLPISKPGTDFTLTASAAITGGQVGVALTAALDGARVRVVVQR